MVLSRRATAEGLQLQRAAAPALPSDPLPSLEIRENASRAHSAVEDLNVDVLAATRVYQFRLQQIEEEEAFIAKLKREVQDVVRRREMMYAFELQKIENEEEFVEKLKLRPRAVPGE